MRHRSLGSALLLLAICLPARSAAADDCDGPPACCVTDPAAVTTLPLLVAIAYSIFWVKPDDLGSAAGIGITCMLSIIAFQLAQADTLPHVPYLTIADRIYTICYILIAVALACAVLEAYWHRTGREQQADSVDRIGRKLFPVVFLVSCLASSLWGWYAKSDQDADVFVPPAPAKPEGEP